jgi:hypothetical protein
MVELLLQYGASVNMTDSRGRTPLTARSDEATCKAAIHKPEILMEEKRRKNALHQSSSVQEGTAQSYDDENPIGAKMCPLHELP